MERSLPGANVQRNEKSCYRLMYPRIILALGLDRLRVSLAYHLLRFQAGCRKRRLNLVLGFLLFYVVLFFVWFVSSGSGISFRRNAGYTLFSRSLVYISLVNGEPNGSACEDDDVKSLIVDSRSTIIYVAFTCWT